MASAHRRSSAHTGQVAIRSAPWPPDEPLQPVDGSESGLSTRALGRHPGARRAGQRRAALRPRLRASLDDLGRTYEIIVVDDGSRDETYARLDAPRSDGPAPEARPASPQLRADGRDGRRIRPCAGRGDRPDGRRPAERPGRHRALLEKIDEGYDVVSGWRKDRQDGFMRRAPFAHRELADRPRDRRAPARLRLHAEGVSRRDRARDPALRRDAPLPPGARLPGRSAHHRDPGAAPSAGLGQEQLRARPDVQGPARPPDGEVPLRLVDEAELRLRRQRRDPVPARHRVRHLDGVREARQRRLRLPPAVAHRRRLPLHDRLQPHPPRPARRAHRPHAPRVAVEARVPRARAAQLRGAAAAPRSGR